MSSGEDRSRPEEAAREESFLGRWSRLKRAAREQAAAPARIEAPDSEAPVPAEAPVSRAERGSGKAPMQHGDEPPELPPIESLTAESDFGAFMKPGVGPELRRLALRKLWSNPKYGEVDPLDPFRADFAAFTALGDTVTADMKFHAERLLRKQLEEAAQAVAATGADSAGADGELQPTGGVSTEARSGPAADAGDAGDGDPVLPAEDGSERSDA
jgi:hypothetical protein